MLDDQQRGSQFGLGFLLRSTCRRLVREIGAWPYVDRAEFFLRLAQAMQGRTVDLAEPMLRILTRGLAGNSLFIMALPLRSLASVAGHRGEMAPATRLWAAGAAMSPPSLVELHRMRERLPEVRRLLGDRFDEEVEAGRRLTPAEAVELAFARFDSD